MSDHLELDHPNTRAFLDLRLGRGGLSVPAGFGRIATIPSGFRIRSTGILGVADTAVVGRIGSVAFALAGVGRRWPLLRLRLEQGFEKASVLR